MTVALPMQTHEYETMSLAEEQHWWYQGFRDLAARVFANPAMVPQQVRSVLDVGCGTGANLRWLQARFPDARLNGFDVSSEAVQRAGTKAPLAEVYESDLRTPELRGGPYDLVFSCDALYVPGLADSFEGLKAIVDAMRPGAIFLLHLPAYQWMYSDHDRAVGTKERYTTMQVRRLWRELGLHCEMLTYRLCLLFPLIVARRVPQWIFPARTEMVRSDLEVPSVLLNRLLLGLVKWENHAIAKGVKLPWGSSVFSIARKID